MEDDTNNLNLTMTGDEIVVSGMSGLFPNSDSVQEFMENLYNKVDMVSINSEWSVSEPEVPKYSGKIKGEEKFDNQFFKVPHHQVNMMEPMSRKLLEHAYGAIFDSGNTHMDLKGQVVGVFIGCSFADSSITSLYHIKKHSDNIINGSSRSMMANRISYWMDGTGPSYCLDYSCASSAAALEHAFNSMKAGDCDAAVVGGCSLCTYSSLTLNMKRAGLLCLDGKTKCFDKTGDGYVRSDAISLIFLQKAKDAKRVYAEVCYTAGTYNLKDNDRFLPLQKADAIQNLLKNIYSKIDVDPMDVEYIEANGAGLAEADENEVEAMASVFNGNRVIKLGSVKSNMGNSEAASGLCSLTKLCLAYHKGEIPANIHLQDPVQLVKDGKVQIVTENAKFSRGYTALNNLSYTGANYHVVLKGHYKKKNLEKYNSKIPRIVLASGRQESSVSKIFDALKSKQVDAEEIALLHNIFENDIVEHTIRGYTILDSTDNNVSENINHYTGVKPPLWFVFSGMGSQWAKMGADLMRIPTFAASIERCHKVLQPYGLDVIKIISDPSDNVFDKTVNAFAGIGAVQIGLIDILKELGIVPDHIIGHSLGELACAYQDETLTAEQMLVVSLCRSKALDNIPFIKGSMAAVGEGYKNLVKYCPPEIDIGCHNSSESSTISGPADAVETFIDELTKRGIFAKSVPSANIAYHSRYIADAGPSLLKNLKEVITNPKPRSNKWISTSVSRDQWDDTAAKYSSAEYYMNNLIRPVLFEEMTSMIPDNAVVVEIAPHGLLQAILKRSLKTCTHIPLTKRGTKDGVKFLLEAIGKLYTSGFSSKVHMLYPKVEFPVSTETPLLSHLVAWEHSEDWTLLTHEKYNTEKITSSSRNMVFSLQDDDYEYLAGYYRSGVNVLPEAALLAFVWETLAMYHGMNFQELSVIFKNIQFHNEIKVTPEVPVRLTITISKGNDIFEVTEEGNIIVSGKISGAQDVWMKNIFNNHDEVHDEFLADIKLTAHDIYKIFKMRGLDYKGKFQSIFSANLDRSKALLKWNEHWIQFLDSLIQLNMVSRDYNGILKPKFIRELRISIKEHKKTMYKTVSGYKCYEALTNNTYGITRCAGVEISDITYNDVPPKEYTAGALESLEFIPFFSRDQINMTAALTMSLQIITENSNSKDILIAKVVADAISAEFNLIDELINKSISINVKIKPLQDNEDLLTYIKNNDDTTNVILLENIVRNLNEKLNTLQRMPKDCFILSLEEGIPRLQLLQENNFKILSCLSDEKKTLILMKKENNIKIDTIYFPLKFDDSFSWVPDLYNKLATTKRVVLISERQPYCGALGLVKKLKANGNCNISVFVINDYSAPKFDPDNDLYKEQLQKNMTINIMRKGQWGSFYSKASKLTLKPKSFVLKNLNPKHPQKLSWVEAPKISGDKTLAQVCYSGLSMEDCQKNMGYQNLEVSLIGMDFSGIDSNGDKIMGLIAGGSAASTIEVDPDLIWPVPDHWTLEDAATVPLAYVKAYYCLALRSKLRKRKTVLICDGSDSLGLALISLCISMDCTVFPVVDNEDKKQMLLRLYPQLNENNIICSNNDGFYYTLMLNTMSQGCDYVISSATGTSREAAAKCVGVFGIFLDISKTDMYENKSFGMSILSSERSYMAVDMSNIFKLEYAGDKKLLQKYIIQGIKSGVVKPLSRAVFSPHKVDEAIRVLSLNNFTGKVLIRVKDPSNINSGLETVPRLSYSPQDVIIIICDENEIGIKLADKLIERGAQKIVLHIKTNCVSGYIHTKLLTWSKKEVSIKISSDNLQTEKGSTHFMNNAMKFGTVKGVFILFNPKPTDNGTKDDFKNNFNELSRVVVNLDVATRNCLNLSHFVVLSGFTQSISEKYSLSLIERVCESRNEMGFPALVVHYESLLELDNTYNTKMDKIKPQSLAALFNAIETSLKLNYKNVLTYDLKRGESQNVKKYPKDEDLMYTFYKHVETEVNIITSQAIVEVPTLLNNGKKDWNFDDSYIIMVPGFEGRTQIFKSIAERLKIRAVSIQLEPDFHGKCIEEIAINARQKLSNKFEKSNEGKRFFILGYSFGVNIALELAAILESEGKTGVVYCIDGSPDALQAILEDDLGKFSEDQLQNHVLNHMYNLIAEKNDKELESNLQVFDSFEAKLEECVRRLHRVGTYSNQYKNSVLESAYNRIIMARKYRPQFKLRSQLVLMKSSKNPVADKLKDDYNLFKYSYKPVKVYTLHADDSAAALNDCRVSNIVNQFIDAEILDNFKKNNLCYVYLPEIRQ